MEFNPLHNFISPVTGRVLSDPDYVLVGNKKGIAIPSPILIDIRLDLQKVQNEIDKLTPFSSDISFIIKTPDSRVPNAQAMSILADGFMFNNAGTISTTNLNFAPHDATYILKQPNQTLTNAQVLSELGTGMAKIIIGGAFAIAVPDEDYATQATLEQIKAETEEFKNQAATSAEEASTSATEASASATEASASATEATAAATEATGAAAEATAAATVATGAAVEATTAATVATGAAVEATTAAGAAGISAAAAALSALSAGSSSSSASSSASDASSSASNAHDSAVNSSGSASQSLQYLNQLLNTGITLTGDVLGAGPLKDPITLTFKENPVFLGHQAMTIPVGSTAQRPSNPITGMVRLNTDF
jgi:hypothetical protein